MKQPSPLAIATDALAHWKQALGLQAWHIEIEIKYALVIGHAEAEIDSTWQSENARITLLHPDSYQAAGLLGGQDIERAVVHELLHLILDPIEPQRREGLEWKVFEQVLDRIARALVAARAS